MTRVPLWLISIGVLIIAGLLAFPLRETIYETVVIPAAFILWNLELLYRSFSQGTWWWVIVFLVLFMLVFSLAPQTRFRPREGQKAKPPQGQVEGLAIWLHKAEKGVYFKWLVANRLGKLAYQILLQRESGRPRSVFTPLRGVDWEPKKELQQYLETGLHGSFADFPQTSRLSAHQPTPLDLRVAEAVDFLESQVENGHLPERHGDTES
jgi:hypothetical protein